MIKAALRSAASHRLRLLLTMLAVMFGVTFVSGTFIYTDTLDQVFDDMVESGTDSADVYVRPEVEFQTLSDYGGGGPGLPETMVGQIQDVDGVAAAEGYVGGYAQFVDQQGEAIAPFGPPTLGMSWTSTEQLNTMRIVTGEPPAGPHEVAMDAQTANDHGFAVGDSVEILLQGPKATFELVGILDRKEGSGFAGATIAAFDQGTAQMVLGKGDRYDQIDVAASDGVTPDELRSNLAAALPDDIETITAQDEATQVKSEIQQGFSFFTTVLLVFAGVSLFVGAFIIFNTFSIIVAQRMREFGLLRAIGATGRQVVGMVLIEAVAIGVIASILGIAAGFGAAVGLQALMDAVGIDLPTAPLELEMRTIVTSAIVGIGVTLFSAALPARRAGRIPPIAALQEQTLDERGMARRRLWLGSSALLVGLAAATSGLLGISDLELPLVGVGVLLVFLGIAILSPVFAKGLAGALAAPLPRLFGVTGTMARENSRRAPRRTAATAAALMVGLALVTLVATFASSLKGSVENAMEATVKADLVVMPKSLASTIGFTPRIATDVRSLPEVRVASQMRMGEWEGDDGDRRTLVAVDPATIDQALDLDMVSGSVDALSDGGILVREAEADLRGIEVGDAIEMTFGATGARSVEVDGIFAAEMDDRYLLSMDTYEENFPRQLDIQLHIAKADGVSTANFRKAVEGVLAAYPNVQVLDQAELREVSAGLIDQMLNMVYGLLALALIIAVLGIANTLALSVHERRREMGLLRAIGATPRQLRRMIRWEAAVIALFGTVLGVVIGIAFGWALIQALEDEGFNTMVVPVVQVVIFIVVAGFAGSLAAALPARRAGRLNILESIAYE